VTLQNKTWCRPSWAANGRGKLCNLVFDAQPKAMHWSPIIASISTGFVRKPLSPCIDVVVLLAATVVKAGGEANAGNGRAKLPSHRGAPCKLTLEVLERQPQRHQASVERIGFSWLPASILAKLTVRQRAVFAEVVS
jgi:hypothetical protein